MISHAKKYLLLVLALVLSACSTMQGGTTQEVTFTSNPDGVEVYEMTFSGEKLLGVTPATIPLGRDIGKVLIFKKEGFKSKVVNLSTEVDKASYLNAANLMVGDAVDTFTGAKYKYKDSVYVELEPSVEQEG